MFIAMLACLLMQAPTPGPSPIQGAQAPHAMNPERMLQRLEKALHLTDAQVPRVQQILETQAKQAEQDRVTTGGDRKAMIKAGRARMDATDKAMEGVLTSDQMLAYQNLKEQAKAKLKQQRKGGGGPGPE